MVFLRKRTWSFGRLLAGLRRKADLALSMHNWLLLWLLLTGKVQFQGLCSVFKNNKTFMTLAACPSLLRHASYSLAASRSPWCSMKGIVFCLTRHPRSGDTAAAGPECPVLASAEILWKTRQKHWCHCSWKCKCSAEQQANNPCHLLIFLAVLCVAAS